MLSVEESVNDSSELNGDSYESDIIQVESIGGAIFIINHHSEPHDSVDIIRSDIKQLHNCGRFRMC